MRVTFTLLGSTFTDVPLFTVIIASILVGVLLAYVIYLFRSISVAFEMHGKDKKVKESEKSVTELTKKIHQLQLEIETLKNANTEDESDDKSL